MNPTFLVQTSIQCSTPQGDIVKAKRREYFGISPTVGMHVDVELANRPLQVRRITLNGPPHKHLCDLDLESFFVDFNVDELLTDLEVQGYYEVRIFLANDLSVSCTPLAYKEMKKEESNSG